MRKLMFTFVIILAVCFQTAMAQDTLTVKDKDGNVLIQVNDEGRNGSITIPRGLGVRQTFDKLYNIGGVLYFNGRGVSPWTLTRTAVFHNDKNVGIGTKEPKVKLHVIGKIKSGADNQRSIIIDGTHGIDDKIIGTANLQFHVGGRPRALRLEAREFSPNIIGGFSGNNTGIGIDAASNNNNNLQIEVYGATIGGGGEKGRENSVTGSFGTVGGGVNNHAFGRSSTVGGGRGNFSSSNFSTIAGGQHNWTRGRDATIGGGSWNFSRAYYATVAGGQNNAALAIGATVSGGGGGCILKDCLDPKINIKTLGNIATGRYATVAGGEGNLAGSLKRLLAVNEIIEVNGEEKDLNGTKQPILRSGEGDYATVSGGYYNAAWSKFATIGGGKYNTALGRNATIGGGAKNRAKGFHSTVGGGKHNVAKAIGATIAGGGGGCMLRDCKNQVLDMKTIGNIATGIYSTIGGGEGNLAGTIGKQKIIMDLNDNEPNETLFMTKRQGDYATISGGQANTATSSFTTIGGGEGNLAGSILRTAVNIEINNIPLDNIPPNPGDYATVGGGRQNDATGIASTVAGGNKNYASGKSSMIPGGAHNEATGRFSFAAGRRAKATSHGSFVWGDGNNHDITSGKNNNSFVARATGGIRFITRINANGKPIRGVVLRPGSEEWIPISNQANSDRNLKENFKPVIGRQILEKLNSISIQTWNYDYEDPSIRHIGPMAQDFYKAFNVGEDDKHIDVIDASGVALAGIQELYRLLQEKDEEIKIAKAELQTMKSKMAEFEELKIKMAQMQSILKRMTNQPVRKASNLVGSE